MKKIISITMLSLIATAGAQTMSNVQLGLVGGYAQGLSGEGFIMAPNVAGPVGLKIGVAVTRPSDAINDNSDLGSGPFSDAKAAGATESGLHTVTSIDATYGLGELAPNVETSVYAGGRYGAFESKETYGEEGTIMYRSNAFGIGAGTIMNYALTSNLGLVADFGVNHFFKSPINIQIDGENSAGIAPGDEGYNDIDNRFVRPSTNFKARVGVTYRF